MKPFVILFFLSVSLGAAAQSVKQLAEVAKPGNRKEILGNIYTGISSTFTQEDGAISLKATPYGIGSIFNKTWKVDSNYIKMDWLRRIQLNGGLTPRDSSLFKMKSGSIGLTFTLLNNSDLTMANFYKLTHTQQHLADLYTTAIQNIVQRLPEDEQADALDAITASYNKFREQNDIKHLDPRLIAEMQRLTSGKTAETFAVLAKSYKQFVREITNKSLLTFTPQMKYDFTKHSTDNVVFKLNYQVGLKKDAAKKPLYLQVAAKYTIERDSTNKANNLQHAVFSIEPSLNFVLKQGEDDKSIVELQPALLFNPAVSHRYEGENDQVFSPALTARLRLGEDTWMPLQIVYDSKNGKYFGFLSIFWNMGN